MENSRHTTRRRWGIALACAPCLLLLAGCPQNDPLNGVGAPGKVAPAATAPAISSQQQQAEQQRVAQQLADNQHAQQVQALVAKAQASYNSGVANYNAGRLDAARQDFDFAVDTMLASNMDLKNDPVLSDEFDQLLSAINSLEMVALKQGNGFSPQIEEAPLEAANEVTFASDPALLSKVTAELKTTKSDFPLVVNDYVAGFINYFANSPRGHAHLKASLERAGKYKDMIEKVLADNGVPQDLIYQAVAESGFQPQVVNGRSGAGGMWQFMPFGSYGLARNGYFDERFDPQKSTVAYAKYMKALYNQFGDWYLAMAAYDWGPGNVQRVVSRTGYADFWELYRRNALPGETKNYVPGIIAAIIVAKNPAQYGFTDITPDAAVVSDTVTTSYAIDMRLVADLTGASVQEIVGLNPSLLRLVTPSDISCDLHLPVGTKDTYLERLKDIPEANRASWRYHVVKQGESLDEIAAQYHAQAAQIAKFNEVTAAQPIEEGDELIIPIASAASASLGQEKYTPRRGDTMVTIADRFGVTVNELEKWNHTTAATPGKVMYVAEPVRLAPATRGSRRPRGRAASGPAKGRTATTAKGAATAKSSGTAAKSSATAKNTPAKSKPVVKPQATTKKPATKPKAK